MIEKICKAITAVADNTNLNDAKVITITVLNEDTFEVQVECESQEYIVEKEEAETECSFADYDVIGMAACLLKVLDNCSDLDEQNISILNAALESGQKVVNGTYTIVIKKL